MHTPPRILIVDDSAPMRRFIASLVGEIPAETREAENGADALAAYDAWRPDLVLMDIRMPVMDGIEATRRLCDAHPDARVIMVTDHDSPVYRADALAAGARCYMLKSALQDLEDAVLHCSGATPH